MWRKHTIKHPETGTSYTYHAKVYDEPSAEYGLNGGRISKLTIYNDDTGEIEYNYDRGLDIDCETKETRDILNLAIGQYHY